MTTNTVPDAQQTTQTRAARSLAGPLSAAAGITGSALIFLLGNPLSATTGAGVTDALIANELRLRAVAWLAALACAGLILAGTRLARAAGGTSGQVIAAAGPAAAVLMLAYYASFAAGAAVATAGLSAPGAGVGEATLVVLNAFSLTLTGAGLALLVASAASPALPRISRLTAGVLAVLLLVPFTAWMVNLVLPLWLGLAAWKASPRR